MTWRRFLLILAAAAGAVLLLVATETVSTWMAFLQGNEIQAAIAQYGWRGRALFFGLASIRPFIFLPVSFFFVSGGIVFGTAEGSFWSIAGLMISSTLAYWLAYRFQGFFHRVVQDRYIHKVQGAASRNLVSKIFTLRATPGAPYDVITYAAGLTNVSYRKFMLGTLLGTLPKGILYTYLGDNLDNYFSPQTLFVYALLLGLALAPHVSRWIRKKRRPQALLPEPQNPVIPWQRGESRQ